MADLRILVPQATTNYVKNPSFRYTAGGWTAFGSTISRSLLESRFGIASLQVVTNGTIQNEGVYYRINWLAGISQVLTASVYVRGTGIVRLRLIEGSVQSFTKKLVLSDKWQRIQVLGRSSGSSDVRLYVETDQKVQATTFYVDGAMLEPREDAGTYCDGDQPGCRWSGISHDSLSTREAYTREGGKWFTLMGKQRIDQDLYMTVVGGLGVASITNNTQRYAMAPGSYYQGFKQLARIFTLTFHTVHKTIARHISLKFLHQLRTMLFDMLKPDRTRAGQEFLLEYTDGDTPLYIRARYDGGMEGEWDIRNQWENSFPVRFLAVSPFLQEDDQETDALNFMNDLGVINNVAARIEGAWSNLNFGLNSTVRGFTIGPDGKIYAFGDFLFANNSALAVSPNISAAGIAYWDGEKWNKMGSGAISSNGYIASAAVAPNGYVYVTGSFSSIGGVAASNAAYWDGSAWNAMGAGVNAAGSAVKVAPNGRVYFGGSFTSAGGQTVGYCAYWDGSWHSLGTYAGLNNIVEDLAITQDGLTIYFGGQFTDERTNPLSDLNYVAVFDVATNTFAQMGAGMDTFVYSLALSADGVLYATGAFTIAGTATVNYAALWDGTAWKTVGTGLNAQGNIVSVAPNGDVYFGGNFTEAGDIDVSYAARWNGSVWFPLDISIALTGTPSVQAILVNPYGDLYIGGSAFSTASKRSKTSAITYVTNIGSAETFPVMYILGPGSLKWLENQTTRKLIQFELDILDDEEVFLDFGRGIFRSTVRGDLMEGVLPGSNFRDFSLLPGENKIAAYMLNDVASYMQLTHVPRHWSVDYTETPEGF